MKQISVTERFAVASAVGLAGGAVALAITSVEFIPMDGLGFVRVASAGAFLAGLTLAPGFGRSGLAGWFMSGAAFGAATVLGAVIAVMLMPVDEVWRSLDWLSAVRGAVAMTLIGPLFVVGALAGKSEVWLCWIAALTAVQGLGVALTRLRTP